MTFLVYAAIGVVAGLLAGLLGVGGGLVIVPSLIAVFTYFQFSPEILTHLAVGTSLATIVFTSVSSIRTHHQSGALQWPLAGKISLGIVVGAGLGAVIADALQGPWLQFLFGAFTMLMAMQMGLGFKPDAGRSLPSLPGLMTAGVVIGSISSVFGIGGGSLTVPFLSWCNVKMQQAVATSAAIGFPIAVSGAAAFMMTGWNETGLPEGATGYVYWPAFVGIVLCSVIFANLGAKLAHRLPSTTLKKVFAFFIGIVGFKLLWGSGVIS